MGKPNSGNTVNTAYRSHTKLSKSITFISTTIIQTYHIPSKALSIGVNRKTAFSVKLWRKC